MKILSPRPKTAIDQDALRAVSPATKQHGGKEKELQGTFKNKMKAKRHKTGDGGGKKNEKGNILERQELVQCRD